MISNSFRSHLTGAKYRQMVFGDMFGPRPRFSPPPPYSLIQAEKPSSETTSMPSRKPVLHELKIDPQPFDMIRAGKKTFELRKNDRDFQAGDVLCLCQTCHSAAQMADGAPLAYTGDKLLVDVTHIMDGPFPGLAAGWVGMSVRLITDRRPLPPRAPGTPPKPPQTPGDRYQELMARAEKGQCLTTAEVEEFVRLSEQQAPLVNPRTVKAKPSPSEPAEPVKLKHLSEYQLPPALHLVLDRWVGRFTALKETEASKPRKKTETPDHRESVVLVRAVREILAAIAVDRGDGLAALGILLNEPGVPAELPLALARLMPLSCTCCGCAISQEPGDALVKIPRATGKSSAGLLEKAEVFCGVPCMIEHAAKGGEL